MRQHVLDANALYRFITGGDGADIVADVFKRARTDESTSVMMSVIAWGEVYYTLIRHIGVTRADRALEQILQLTGLHLIRVEERDARKAAELKAKFNIPHADAFTAALTGGQHVVVTADVDHFERVPKIRILRLPHHRA
jgi:predicted nucleic acid-binding protein